MPNPSPQIFPDNDSKELLISTSRNLIALVGGMYLVWHFIATLTWPRTFSPNLWGITIPMVGLIFLSLRLLERYYAISLSVWIIGLAVLIFYAFVVFERSEILWLLMFLPVMAIVTVGFAGTIMILVANVFLLQILNQIPAFPEVPSGFITGIVLGSVFCAFFGWGLSSNLLSALDAAAYHFGQARQLLEETRKHRAEISVMLKDRNQANYQLERLNQMLRFARRRAEEARSDRDRFVLAVSHELRSPLNFILGFSDLMANSPETYAPLNNWPPGLYDDAQEIYRSSRHLLGLINDILDMGQIDAKQMILYREELKLEEIILEVQDMVGSAFEKKGLQFAIEIEANLPTVYVDRTRLRQVLLNLVNNGLRFTENGKVSVVVRSTAEAIEVCVKDTGSGIAEEDLPKVFEEFRQVGVDQFRRREGSGLGLTISRRFVELHGGKMWLESRLGQGTSIYFTIPFHTLSTTEPLLKETRLWPDKGGEGLPVVLLWTNDPAAIQEVQNWLEGYQVIVVSRPDELLSKVIQFYPHAVLVDQLLFEQQNISLRDLPYDLPVVSIVFPEGRERTSPTPPGVLYYLVKPVSRQKLKETVNQSIDIGGRVLVVDDDPAMLRFVELVLTEYNLVSANTAQQALTSLRTEKIDLVLLDLDLPDRSGWDILAQVRQGGVLSGTKVIIVSALDLPHNIFVHGQPVMSVNMKRPLSSSELTTVLKPFLNAVQPNYPNDSNRDSSQD
jgi:signal transduction histidine kinase/CheY-like chemotaxis protein